MDSNDICIPHTHDQKWKARCAPALEDECSDPPFFAEPSQDSSSWQWLASFVALLLWRHSRCPLLVFVLLTTGQGKPWPTQKTLLSLGTEVQSPGVWATFSVLLTSWFDWPLRKTQRQTAFCGGSRSFSLAIRPFLAQIKTQLPQGAWAKSPKVIALCRCIKFTH